MPSAKPRSPRTPFVSRQTSPPEVVDPIWLLKALALCVVAALLCGYATLCLVFYQGRWQLVLHPSRIVDHTPASVALSYSDVRFDASETGQPRLTAWWIPAPAHAGFESRYAAYTVLYLHDGSGSLSDTVPMLARLHFAGLNVFAFDYRGFGASDASFHPSQVLMSEDCAAALAYLTSARHIPSRNIIPYGVGLGAPLAASLALTHSELPAIILDNPDPDPASTAAAARPSRVVPVRWLFGHDFDITSPIATLTTPKLLIAGGPNAEKMPNDPSRIQALFEHAASPSLTVNLPPDYDESQYQATLSRFLDEYLPTR